MMLVIGDVHGHLELLKALLGKYGVAPGAQVCLVGDLIDRGPDSRGVVRYVRESGIRTVLGNHERMMLDTLLPVLDGLPAPRESRQLWLANGGRATLISYGFTPENGDAYLNAKVGLPPDLVEDLRWMEGLPHYLEFPEEVDTQGRYLVVSHSNCLTFWENRDHPIALEGILWDRDQAFDHRDDPQGVFNVFGHTPLSEVYCLGNFACVDTGAYHTGRLSGITFPGKLKYSS